MNIKNMVFSAFLVGAAVSNSTASAYITEEYRKIELHEYFLRKLTVCSYSPECILYLRKKHPHPKEIAIINAILKQHYYFEYQNAIAQLDSKEEKLRLLEEIQDHLIRELDWIDKGWEPALKCTDDGSDRGVEGLRFKVLKEVMKEVAYE